MATIPYGEVHVRLAEAVPEFRPEIDEHTEFNDGVLSHLLFGDLTRFVLSARDRGDQELVDRCLAFLARAFDDGDPDVQNLVAVSFVENVGPWDNAEQAFIESWPGTLREEAHRQRDWKPGDPGV